MFTKHCLHQPFEGFSRIHTTEWFRLKRKCLFLPLSNLIQSFIISCYYKLEKRNPTNITVYDDDKQDASCGSSQINSCYKEGLQLPSKHLPFLWLYAYSGHLKVVCVITVSSVVLFICYSQAYFSVLLCHPACFHLEFLLALSYFYSTIVVLLFFFFRCIFLITSS